MRIFTNPDDGRLRAGWRILILVATVMALAGGTLTALNVADLVPPPGPAREFFAISVAAIVATAAVVFYRRTLDRKTVVSFGLRADRRAVADVVFGFVLSGAMAAALFAAMAAAGWLEIRALPRGLADVPWGALAAYLALHAIVSWWEELVFRGYILQNMAEGLGLPVAVTLSCLLYGLVHAANPNAGALSSSIIVLFGLLRIYGWLATRQLWLSLGMHLGWNWFQGPVFGWAASGRETASLIDQAPAGPAWWSGGAFGPEASLLTIPVLGLAALAMRAWAARGDPDDRAARAVF